MDKKIIIFLILLLSINIAFSPGSWSVTCDIDWWHVGVAYGCTTDYNCGANAIGSGCSSSCSYCGAYTNPCRDNTDTSGTCTCNSGYCKTSSNTCVGNAFNNAQCGDTCTACASDEFCSNGACYKNNGQSQFKGYCVGFGWAEDCRNNAYALTDVCDGNQPACSCSGNYRNCDAETSNGCESNIKYDNNNCNSCGNVCTGGSKCINGACVAAENLARIAAEIDVGAVSNPPDWWMGNNHLITTNCQDNPTYCTSNLHNYNGNSNALDTGTIVDFTGWIKCSSSVYKNCNYATENAQTIIVGSTNMYSISGLDGCETDIRHFNTACGSCSTSCNMDNQWCWQGSCYSKTGWDYTHGSCSGTTSVCPSNSVVDTSGAYGSNTCSWGGSPKCNCNSGYKNCDGVAGSSCEIQVSANISNCGACGRVCSTWLDTHNSAGEEVSTLADSGQCSDYKLGGSKSMCQYSCNSGSCSALSLSRGQCDNPGETTQCVSGKTCIESITDLSANIDSGRSWCCSSTQCSYNGVCYEEGAMIHDIGANSASYFCSSSYKWTLVGTNLNLSRMISQPRSNININSVNYFSDLGAATTCSGGSACVISGPKYSYKYCFSYNIVFDGMFNIETNNNVPVKVSEQDLYNPYFRPVEIIPTNTTCITPEGTNESIMYCAVKP